MSNVAVRSHSREHGLHDLRGEDGGIYLKTEGEPCVTTRGQTAALGSEAVGGTAGTQEDIMTATFSRRPVSLVDDADALAVSTRTIRRYIAEGQHDAVRLGRKTLARELWAQWPPQHEG